MSQQLPLLIRQCRPLVYAITNFVTMEWVARGLLAAGASPVMARDRTESAAVAESADALVLNLGTWSPDTLEAMIMAGKVANRRAIPIILDPVGAGGLNSRTEAAFRLLEAVRVTVIRGNRGEIAALAGTHGQVRGVDTLGTPDHADTAEAITVATASRVANRFGCMVAATGTVDLVTNGSRTLRIRSGVPLMAQVPGTGCLVSALIAAALATKQNWTLEGIAEALLWAGYAGEEAARVAAGPGTFAAHYLDHLAAVTELPAGRMASPLAERLSLYVIVDSTTPPSMVNSILNAGVQAIQFREKRLTFREQLTAARTIRDLCHARGALFVVNDRIDLAFAVKASGVHLGQDDLPVGVARQLLGPNAVIGATCETPAEALRAHHEGADYIGTGPVYATPSKLDAGQPYGPPVVARVSAAVPIPVVGIGGITIGKAAPVIAVGGSGVSVIAAITRASDPAAAARALLHEIRTAKEGVLL